MKIKNPEFRILAIATAVAFSMLPVQSAPPDPGQSKATFELPLLQSGDGRLEGVLAEREFSFRLPEHVQLDPGSEMVLGFRSSPLLLDVSSFTVSINERQIGSVRLGHEADGIEKQSENKLVVPIPEGVLQAGWNRLVVRCLLQTTQTLCRDVDNPAAWMEFGPESVVRVAYTNLPLFTEIQRFPDSITEPVLMQLPEFRSPDKKAKAAPVVSLLLPEESGDPELRSFLIAAARLGQTVYTPPEAVSVGDIGEFSEVCERRNGVLIGARDQLAEQPLPGHIKKALSELQPGQGFLAELIYGPPETTQRRWIILSGADGAGLEKAALTLGSAVALRSVPSNPWIIAKEPEISPLVEKISQPEVGPLKLSSLENGEILLRGIFRNSTSRRISFPPGFETTGAGYVEFDFTHADQLEKASAFEARLNDAVLGSVALAPNNSGAVKQRLSIPAGIVGRDPSLMTVSSYLDIGSVDCAHRNAERAWLNISGETVVDLRTTPLKIDDLSRLNLLCLRDAFLRRAALLVPEDSDSTRNDLIKTIGMHLGSRLPDMPVLWPQVATFGPEIPPEPHRVEKRSGLVLGSAFQWPEAFAENSRLIVQGGGINRDQIILRGEKVPVTDFDPNLSFVQLVASPWTAGEFFAAIGGLENYGGDATIALINNPGIFERLRGTVSALDGDSRLLTYDVRSVQEVSLSQTMRLAFSPDRRVEDLEAKEIKITEAGLAATALNIGIGTGALALLAGLFLIQRFVVRRRHKNHSAEKGDEL